jgi:hypothetical protein
MAYATVADLTVDQFKALVRAVTCGCKSRRKDHTY